MVESLIETKQYVVPFLTAGVTYRFKIAARNNEGYSALSDYVEILAAQMPDKPAPPTTTLVGENIEITWDAPPNGGSPITNYAIRIM